MFCLSSFLLWRTASSGEQMERFKKAASAKQLRRVSSMELPACVVVKSGDAADAGEVLQVRDWDGQGRDKHSTCQQTRSKGVQSCLAVRQRAAFGMGRALLVTVWVCLSEIARCVTLCHISAFWC